MTISDDELIVEWKKEIICTILKLTEKIKRKPSEAVQYKQARSFTGYVWLLQNPEL